MNYDFAWIRRSFYAAALATAVAAALLPTGASAQAPWPDRPIKLMVPFAAGGSNDNIARVLGVKLAARLGQPVIIENKGGGGGTIGTDFVAKAPADGNTLLFVSTSIATNVASGKKLPFDPVKDLIPIGQVAASPFAVVVASDMKVNSLRDFVSLARAKPRTINYGSAGIGGINHLGTEYLASVTGIELTHAPYKGIGPAFTDLMGGNLQMLLPSLASVTSHIKAGKMKALAVTGPQRSQLAPEIPTVAESGYPGFSLEVWYGLMAPAKTPARLIKRLNEEMNAVLAMPDVLDMLAREGAAARPGTPEEFGGLIRADIVRWTRLIRDRGIQAE